MNTTDGDMKDDSQTRQDEAQRHDMQTDVQPGAVSSTAFTNNPLTDSGQWEGAIS